MTLADAIKRSWWTLLVRGIIAIIIGSVALVWPQITLEAIVILIGVFLILDGLSAIMQSLAQKYHRWVLVLFSGILGVLAGIITLFWPGIAEIVVIYLIAAWALITGILEIVASLNMDETFQGRWLLLIGGILSFVFGIVVFLRPDLGLLAIVVLLGFYALFVGIIMVILALEVRPAVKQLTQSEEKNE